MFPLTTTVTYVSPNNKFKTNIFSQAYKRKRNYEKFAILPHCAALRRRIVVRWLRHSGYVLTAAL